MKKNLFITFPVDAGMKASENSYQKIFEKKFNFESFAYRNENNNNIFNESIRKKRYRFLASFKLRAKIREYTKKKELVIFHGLSPMIYSFGSYNFSNTILCLDATRALFDFAIKKKNKKDFAYYVHKFLLKRIPKILCWTEPVVEMLNKYYKVPSENLFKVSAPIIISDFKMFPRKTPTKPNVLFIGREYTRKGGDMIINNLEKLEANCNLTMATNDMRANIPNVNYFDAKLTKEKILNLYQTHDILILPTKFDPYGFVLAEGAAAGLAVITTKFALGSRDIVEHNKTGLIVDSQVDCLNALAKIIKNPKEIDRFKFAAYHKMQLEFNKSEIYNDYMRIINPSEF